MEVVIIVILIGLNGLLAMSEIALVSLRKSRLEMEAQMGSKAARKALALASQPDRFLSTTQIGITLVGILTGLFSGEAFAADLASALANAPALTPYALPLAKVVIVAVVTYLTLIFGELVPKRIGMTFAEPVTKWMAQPISFLAALCSPFVWLLSHSTALIVRALGLQRTVSQSVTEEEIKAVVRAGRDDGEVQEVEQDIVERVFSLGDRKVGSILTHRNELVWLDVSDTPDVIRRKMQDNLFNVYPVAEGKLDNLLGVVHLKDLFLHIHTSDFSLRRILQPAEYLPEHQSVYKALSVFRQARVKYGIVMDEFGSIQGIVTVKDIAEGLLGELPEDGEESGMTARADGSWLADGQISFYDFLSHFDMEALYNEHEHNTLSGLILEILEHVPATGERLSWYGFDFEIVDMDGARIDKVLVRHATPAAD